MLDHQESITWTGMKPRPSKLNTLLGKCSIIAFSINNVSSLFSDVKRLKPPQNIPIFLCKFIPVPIGNIDDGLTFGRDDLFMGKS